MQGKYCLQKFIVNIIVVSNVAFFHTSLLSNNKMNAIFDFVIDI